MALATEKVDVTFNAWWKVYGSKPETVQKALDKTRQQIGPPMPAGYVPPPLRVKAPAAAAPTPPTVSRISLMTDGFAKVLGWDDVIGLATNDINIEIEATGGTPPATPVRVEVTSWLPNGSSTAGTIKTALQWDVPPAPVPAPAVGTLYRLTKKIGDAGAFLSQSGGQDVVTIARDGGTSDGKFRTELGWTVRGIGTQPKALGVSTGDEGKGRPDDLTLLKAAGVEILKVGLPAGAPAAGSVSVQRLIRKPCRVVYYSGHGLSRFGKNCLGIQTGPLTYECTAKPPDLTAAWTLPDCQNLDYFVIAGCSVLRYQPGTTDPRDVIGLAWSKLLLGKGGPLVALLGYSESAPSDETAGDDLARELATSIVAGKTDHDLVVEWLSINGRRKAWNAVAMDSKGYWWIEPRRFLRMSESFDPFKDIKGPRAIP
jgi:hypothetical protein